LLFVGLSLAEPAPEADPQYLLGGYYGGYPYGGLYRGWGGAHLIGKRSAEAEPEANADAQYLLGGYYGGYPYGGLYRGYGGYHLLGKRSADAEPEAKADPQVLLGGYYGYPYGAYRTLGYPYVWGKK